MEGYEKLAQLMAACSSLAVFRRFAVLSIENLLYLQADLVRLENELRKTQQEDKLSGHKDRARYGLDWTLLLESKARKSDGQGHDGARQLELILEIKSRLKEYNEALFFYRQTLSLKQPHKKVMQDLNDWMNSPARGGVCLIGDDGEIWSNPDLGDLFAFDSTADGFTEWASNHLLDIYHNILGRRVHKKDSEKQSNLQNTIIYTDEGIKRVTRSLTIMVASMLPILTTVVLYFVKDMSKRLCIIAGFTALFSLALGFFTRASLQEIFSATAAFSAVAVVWVGTTSSS